MINRPVWDGAPWHPLPSLVGDTSNKVCVIGLGGSGLACIDELLTLGRSVIGIDAGIVAGGAAGRNGGILRAGVAAFHHDAVKSLGRDRAVRLHQLTGAEIARIAEQAPGTVRMTGSMRIALTSDEEADCALQLAAMRADGLAAEPYDGPLGRGLFFPDNASMQPMARCRALARSVIARGAQLFERTEALTITGTEVVTASGRITCDRVIIAVDGRLESLLPELADTVRTTRLQMLATAPAHDVTIPCPISANYGFDYWQQLPTGEIALGGGRDRDMDREWTQDMATTDTIQRYLESVLRDRIRTVAAITHQWGASVSYTKSGLPVLADVRPGVIATGGYNGSGNLMGALCGRAAAQLSCGMPSELASLLH